MSAQDQKAPEKPKAPERDSIRRELERVQCQLEGLTRVVKRLKEAT